MNAALPTPPFSLGRATNDAPPPAAANMDMSLDDLIKARRTESNKQQKSADTESRRTSVKAKQSGKKPTAVQKSIGSNKAKRNANAAARRGLATSPKASPMDMDREIYRQQRGGGRRSATVNFNDKATTRSSTGPRRSQRTRNNNSGKSAVEQKVKAKNTAAKNKTNKQQKQTEQIKNPTKKAMKAAMSALKESGFDAPKGMKIVVNFVSNDSKPTVKKNANQNGNNAKSKNQGNNSKNNRNRNKGGRR